MPSDQKRRLVAQTLSAAAFAPFGQCLDGGDGYSINSGHAMRYDDVFRIQIDSGSIRTSLFVATGVTLTVALWEMERHPLGSQAFVSINGAPMIAVVAPAGEFDASLMRAFHVPPGTGVNYAAGTWHHPLLSLEDGGRFLVLDCRTDAANCDVVALQHWFLAAS